MNSSKLKHLFSNFKTTISSIEKENTILLEEIDSLRETKFNSKLTPLSFSWGYS